MTKMTYNHDDEAHGHSADAMPAPETERAAADMAAESPAPAAPLMAEDGSFAPDWYKQFADLEPYAASLAKFRRPEALAKSYAHLERLKGYPDTADARRMAAFRASVGLPATEEEFAIARPDNTPDEIWNPQLVKSLTRVAYEYGVPPKAMEALAAHYADEGRRFMETTRLEEQRAVEQADADLQQEWGSRYEENMNTVAAFLSTMGERAGVDVSSLAENPSLRANADFVKLLLEAASLMQEAPLHTGEQPDSRREAHRIAHDPAHPLHEAYMRTSHPQHRYANEQYDRLAFGRKL